MIRNLRDLGGIKTEDGRQLKKSIFIRSAMLNKADAEDCKLLLDMKVSRVIDIRTDDELIRHPDKEIPHIAYIHFPLQKEGESTRLSFRKIREEIASAKDDFARAALIPDMADIYSQMLINDFSRTNLRALVSSLVGYNLGATLFHCTSGKDRTGMVAACILMVLGVSREEILKDYLLSIPSATEEAKIIENKIIAAGGSKILVDAVSDMTIVKERYLQAFFNEIDKQYNSTDDFIRDFLRIDDELRAWFKNRALEKL